MSYDTKDSETFMVESRTAIASSANTTWQNCRIVVADKCGIKTVSSAIISGMGDCPF